MIEFSYSRRTGLPDRITYAIPVATIVLALAVGTLPLLLADVNPLAAYNIILVDTLTSVPGITEVAIQFVPLAMAGLSVYIPLKAGLWNVGAEGQIYVGAVVGAYVALTVSAPLYLLLPLVLAIGLVGGALWGWIPGWLRAKWDVNEIITTLMMSFIAINLTNYMLYGPMQAPGRGGLPATDTLPAAARLPRLGGTRIHLGVFIALACVAVVYFLMTRSRFGFESTVLGSNAGAAKQAGIDEYRVIVLAMAVGGALAGLGGIMEISGAQHRVVAEFSPGYGFTAVVIALLGRNGAHFVGLASLFFAVLFVGGSRINTLLGAPGGIVDIFQALIVLFLITGVFFRDYEITITVPSLERGEMKW